MSDRKLHSSFSQYIILFIFIVIFLGYAIPESVQFFVRSPFTFQNTWDKCTYLSYQGVIGVRNLPGFYPLYLVGWLQDLGIAGSVQAYIFDLIIPVLTVFFLYKVFTKLGCNNALSLTYAIIILYSSVLFNYSDPLIPKLFGPMQKFRFFLVGWETYPSILRSPNPMFSYLILSFFSYLSVKFRRYWLVFLVFPVAFLYFFVLLPYLYLLTVAFIMLYFVRENNLIKVVGINLVVYFLMAISMWLLFILFGHHINTAIIQYGRYFHFNLIGVFIFVVYFLLLMFRVVELNSVFNSAFITLGLCSFAVTNIQLITGFSLELKNYLDYGLSIIAGLGIVLTHYVLEKRSNELSVQVTKIRKLLLQSTGVVLIAAALLFITVFIYKREGFVIKKFAFRIDPGMHITQEQLNKIKRDPLHAIIVDQNFAEFLPFSQPKMLASALAFQYNYPGILKQCQFNIMLVDNAIAYINAHYSPNSEVYKEIHKRAKLFYKYLANSGKINYQNQVYCKKSIYANKDFYVIRPNKTRDFYFPKW